MKTQNFKKILTKILVGSLAVLALMTTACKKGGGGSSTPAPIAPACYTPGCAPGVGTGQYLYGGITTNGFYAQAQFQVYGEASGMGYGSITGTVQFNNFVCQVGMNNLMGPYQIQMTQQGSVTADVFQGSVMLTGPYGSIPASIQVVPTRTQNTGLFSMYVCGQRVEMNF